MFQAIAWFIYYKKIQGYRIKLRDLGKAVIKYYTINRMVKMYFDLIK